MLLIVETVVTVTWQEPFSAIAAKKNQEALGGEFERIRLAPLPSRETLQLRRMRTERTRIAYLAQSLQRRATEGEPLGRISIPELGARFVLVQGVEPDTLKEGPGHYPWTALPGQGGTVAFAGHRTTYLAPFRHVDKLDRGDSIVVTTSYGRFRYRVTRTRIVSPEAAEVLRPVPGEQLLLTACHPPYSAAQRIIVFADLAEATPQGPARVSEAPRPTVDRFDEEDAFTFLRRQVALGRRPAGSRSARKLAAILRAELPAARYQRLPGGLRNVVGTIPGRDPRRVVVVGAHYDTKDLPGFVGANDGASGVAVALGLARSIRPRTLRPTIAFMLFDGEESPRGTPDSQFAAKGLRGSKVAARSFSRKASAMILLDMVGDVELRIPRELGSDVRLWRKLRAAARRVGVASVFPDATQPRVLDDHVPFRRKGVPSIDVIDFDFPCWHRRCDNLAAVSPRSLDAVGETVLEFLRTY
ncbi:MAG: sortase [Actinomycetota bacterium]|nr:sortase [Actinomycetota bacterium]